MIIFSLQNLDYVLSSDNELKNLLDEAFSYKGPKDIENKSDIFKVCTIFFSERIYLYYGSLLFTCNKTNAN